MKYKSINVLGTELKECSCDPMTGFFRDGCCNTSKEDFGINTVCIIATKEFLEFSKSAGIDLSTDNPLFNLPIYFPLAWYIGPDTDIDPLDEGRQMQVVGLIRTNFLKRFESSVAAFEMSCDRLLKKLLVIVDVNSETDGERNRLARWKLLNADILGIKRQFELWDEESD